ncbi:MAG: hypothetical protein JJD93_06890 [Ilumatobacteraceae bacterium]|nr:hypothetical protein [Ilumatobacteraceae bacterium]
MTPRLTTLLLCDFAQVREGLLFVSSGGVSRVVQSNYPANPRLHLAMVVHLPAASLGQSHQVHVRLKYPDTAEVIANAEVAIQLNAVSGAYPGEGINVPQVIDLVSIQFPRPGQVDVQVSIGEHPVGDLSFWLLPAPAKVQ